MNGAAEAGSDYTVQAQRFADLHAGRDAQHVAGNLYARIDMLQAGTLSMPVTVSEQRAGNAWVCSPRTTYADYAAEEAVRLLPRALAAPLRGVCGGIGACLDWAQIDRAVTLNNWLLSTNLYPPLPREGLGALLDAARTRWPDHALWFRSVNRVDTAQWLDALQAQGFTLIGSRQVYLYDDWPALLQHRDLARDLKLTARTDLQRCGNAAIGEADYPRIAALYAQLYLDKYLRCNPAYRAALLRAWHRAGLLHFDGFRDAGGELVCITGLFGVGQTLTAPIVGYDLRQPQRLALYRTLTACGFEHALRYGCRLNQSAGAASFKRQRGGMPVIEYSAVDARHLPLRRRQPIAALGVLTERIGVPVMRRYRL
ncbi:hypothetical protein KAF26_17255 [Xanthomonas translucens pv. secalis]|uniref:hypothetical protein n=1 Tax=Xanthomonas campestris pv. translucens TaxID=343 RepID=UPI001F288638|nr:hypothetical protein [Xanthomonas translucens]UKE43125.1 hypothetical protein KAF26_17255 [Xanthomonas translucens pv. secalis]